MRRKGWGGWRAGSLSLGLSPKEGYTPILLLWACSFFTRAVIDKLIPRVSWPCTSKACLPGSVHFWEGDISTRPVPPG